MKNSKLINIVLVVLISLSVLCITNNIFAATDFTDSLNSQSTSSGTATSTSTRTDDGNATVLSSNKNNTINNNTVLKTNNTTTSTYNNTSLPKTGIEDSMPAVILIIVLGISAVYAYKKMQDYRNI